MVRCRATVDILKEARAVNAPSTYGVEVWGEEPYDYCRKYTILARSDDEAAREGIARFTTEMETLETKVS